MLLLLLDRAVCIVVREIAEEPYGYRAYKYDSAHLLEILPSLFPGVPENRLCRRHPVWRKFHHERQVIVLEEDAHDLGSRNGQYYAQGIEAKKHHSGIAGEEGSGDQDIYRHSSGT